MQAKRLRRLVDARPVVVPTRDVPNLRPIVPFDENDSDVESTTMGVAERVLSRFFAIEYVDAKGRESRRRITVLEVEKGPDNYLIKAVCHERQAVRVFKVSRIRFCFDPETGEVFDDVVGFLRRNSMLAETERDSAADRTRSVLKEFGPELATLVYLARCDGDYSPDELEAIIDFLKDAARPELIDSKEAAYHLQRMEPCAEAVFEALATLEHCPARRQMRFLDAVRLVVESDGQVAPEEFDMLMEMREASEMMAGRVK